MKKLIIAIIILLSLAILFAMIKSKKPVKHLFLSILKGSISLVAVNIIGMVTNITLSVNWYTLFFVSVFGTPGTIGLLFLKLLLR